MADRIEREIEEILAKLETDAPPEPASERKPISIVSHRRRGPGIFGRARQSLAGLSGGIHFDATRMMFTGAALVVGGLVLSNVWPALIWLAFAGVVLFVAAFISSFFRAAPAGAPKQRGVYWRDRYIEYAPPTQGPIERLKRRLRRR